MAEKNSQAPFYKKWWFWVIIVVLVIVGMASSGKKDDKTDKSAEGLIEGTNLSKDAVENECIDAKYYSNSGFQVVDALDANFETFDYAYTENGDKILLTQWNGRSKSTDEKVVFQCYISGNNDGSLTVHYIRAGGNDIWKTESDLNYASYDQDGNPMYSELHGGISNSTSTIDGISFSISKVNNDTTGKWRVSVISEPIVMSDHGVEYYNKFINGKDEIHAIINFAKNTTTKIMKSPVGISVTTYEYVDGEEHDAKKLFSGDVLDEKYYNSQTGEEIVI